MNKKICILTSVHPVFDTRIFYKEAKTLARTGYDVTLIAQHDKDETVDGVKIIALPKPKNRFERFIKLDYLTYKKAVEQKADVYHFHDPELLPWMLKLRKKTKAKIIYDVHEDVAKQILSKYWLPKIFRRLIAYTFDKYEKYIAKKIDYIIAATPDIKNNFKINNIADIKNYPIITNSQKIEEKIEKKYTELIYVGGLSKIRGIKNIIESLKYINPKHNFKLKLIGNFSNKKFEQEIKNISEWKKINFLGVLPQKEAYQCMENANIGFVCFLPEPNHINAIPNKIFEYMINELPIIASNFPLWEKIVEDNNCGICVDPLKPKEIAKVIEYLIKHPDEAKKMGENGRKAVLEKYNWENESKKLLKTYKKLLK